MGPCPPWSQGGSTLAYVHLKGFTSAIVSSSKSCTKVLSSSKPSSQDYEVNLIFFFSKYNCCKT